MSGLFIRIKPEKKIVIVHKGEMLTLQITGNKAYSEFVVNFEGGHNFVIDRETIFLEKLLTKNFNEDNSIK